jgi:hypothetical protein
MWHDAKKECGPDGYKSSSFLLRACERFRRVPSANWFQLIGTIGHTTDGRFVVGADLLDFLPPFPGRLYFFANDLPFMYWNNTGVLSLRITRVQ